MKSRSFEIYRNPLQRRFYTAVTHSVRNDMVVGMWIDGDGNTVQKVDTYCRPMSVCESVGCWSCFVMTIVHVITGGV